MKKLIILYLLLCQVISFFSCKSQESEKPLVIDESGLTEKIIQKIPVDKVWAGHPVGFCLYTHENRQYIAFYNADRHMVVGQRNLSDDHFTLHVLPPTTREEAEGTSTVLGWDSHNSVTLGIDREGYIHMAGNMHVHPLTYFRSTKPHDISTLVQHMEMTGSNEKRCTYPHFMINREGNLLFHYRDGSSGNGNEIYNTYSTETKTWKRLLDTPLTDGQGLMNAYQSQPKLMKDNWYHMYWVWRDTPDCATNHDLSYMKSPDLIHWFNVFGDPVNMPATLDDKTLIVDPVPPGGGIINLAAKMVLDENNKPVFIYHKYGPDGNLQLYVAQTEGRKWVSRQLTNWNYRWEFSGGGSIVFEVSLKDFSKRSDGNYEFSYSHIKYGNGTLLLDSNFEVAGTVIKPAPVTSQMAVEGDFPGLQIRTAGDLGNSGEPGIRYMLRWETLPANRDKPRPEPWPGPSQLYLYKVGN